MQEAEFSVAAPSSRAPELFSVWSAWHFARGSMARQSHESVSAPV